MKLEDKKCIVCEGACKPFTKTEAKKEVSKVSGWQLASNAKSLSREWKMKNFLAALKFINKVGVIAEKEQHHPDIHLTGYRKLRIELSTHSVGGLSENDFILAAKINTIPAELKS